MAPAFGKVLSDEAELWERFCVGQAGVPMDRYLPKKRIVILVGQAGDPGAPRKPVAAELETPARPFR